MAQPVNGLAITPDYLSSVLTHTGRRELNLHACAVASVTSNGHTLLKERKVGVG